ncbi:MAG: hypothetical protein ACFE0O_15455, partial [Opitutales bacterium]
MAGPAFGQILEQPVRVLVGFQTEYNTSGPAPDLGVTLNGVTQEEPDGSTGDELMTDLDHVDLVLGKEYQLSVTRTDIDHYLVFFDHPKEFQLLIDQVPAEAFARAYAGDDLVTVALVEKEPSDLNFDIRGSLVAGDTVIWRMDVGTTQIGREGGTISLRIDGADKSANPDILYKPDGLSFVRQSADVQAFFHGAALRQVIGPRSIYDIEVLTTTSYTVTVYPLQALGSWNGSWYNIVGGIDPIRAYTFEKDTTTHFDSEDLLVTWVEYDDDGSTYTREFRYRQANDGSFRERLDWKVVGGSHTRRVRQEVVVGQTDLERLTIDENGSDTAFVKEWHFTQFGWGWELTKEVVDPDNAALTTDIDYYTDPLNPGHYRQVKSRELPDNTWSFHTYYDDFETRGKLKGTYKPWRSNAPATPQASTTGTRFTETEYKRKSWIGFAVPHEVRVKEDGHLVEYSKTELNISSTANTALNERKLRLTRRDFVVESPSNPLVADEYVEAITETLVDDTTDTIDYTFGGTVDRRLLGMPYVTRNPDGTQVSHAYFWGTHNPSNNTFTADGVGSALLRVTLTGTTASAGTGSNLVQSHTRNGQTYHISPIYLTNSQSTIREEVYDGRGALVFSRSLVKSQNGTDIETEKIGEYLYTRALQLKGMDSAQRKYSASYDKGHKVSETGSDGITHTFTHDPIGRIITKTKLGKPQDSAYPGNPGTDLRTTFTYDATHNVLSESTEPVTGGGDPIVHSRTYDLAGRLISRTHPDEGTTTIAYDTPNRKTTWTYADGGTKSEYLCKCGTLRKREGTAVTDALFSFSYENKNGQWLRVTTEYPGTHDGQDPDTPEHYVITKTDMLGRVVEEIRSVFGGDADPLTGEDRIRTITFNNRGQKIKERVGNVTAGYRAATLWEYDAFGRVSRTGRDVDAPYDELVPASQDEIQLIEYQFWYDGLNVWKETETFQYPTNNNDECYRIQKTRERLNNNVDDGVFALTEYWDPNDNRTIVEYARTYTAAREVVKTKLDGVPVGNHPTTVSVNGYQVFASQRTTEEETRTFDAYHRPATVATHDGNSPRTTTTVYQPGTRRAATVTNPDGNITTYAYDARGRTVSTTNSLGQASRKAYDAAGNIVRQWGDNPYPLEYAYDDFGRPSTLTRYRAGTGWDQASWPAASTGAGDTVTFAYDPASRLLSSRTDAGGAVTAYEYDIFGQETKETKPNGVEKVTTYYLDTGRTFEVYYVIPPGLNLQKATNLKYFYHRNGLVDSITEHHHTDWYNGNATSRKIIYNMETMQYIREEFRVGDHTGSGVIKLYADRDSSTLGHVGRIWKLEIKNHNSRLDMTTFHYWNTTGLPWKVYSHTPVGSS